MRQNMGLSQNLKSDQNTRVNKRIRLNQNSWAYPNVRLGQNTTSEFCMPCPHQGVVNLISLPISFFDISEFIPFILVKVVVKDFCLSSLQSTLSRPTKARVHNLPYYYSYN